MIGWRFDVLDRHDQVIGQLDGVTGGNGEVVAQSSLGGSASINFDRDQGLNFLSDRLRAVWVDGDAEYPFGTYLFASPDVTTTGSLRTFQVKLLTKMNLIADDALTERLVIPAGANPVAEAVSLLVSTGETRVSVTDTDLVTVSELSWDAGTDKLTVINKLLSEVAGYWALWCDGTGLYRVEPYVDPASRAVSHTFKYGETSLFVDGWGREQNLADVPNRFIAVGEGSEDAPPLVGIAENNDPASDFSIPARGVKARVEEGVEAADQTTIDQYAARRLLQATDPVANLTVSHSVRPMEQNQVVSFTGGDMITRLATVQRFGVNFTPDTVMTGRWREI